MFMKIMKRWAISRLIYIILGFLSLGLGIIGIAVPGLPTTPFVLLAAGLFAKSSPRLYQRLLQNRTFGPIIHHWQNERKIPRKAKRAALIMMAVAAVMVTIVIENLYLKLGILVLIMIPVIYISRLATVESPGMGSKIM